MERQANITNKRVIILLYVIYFVGFLGHIVQFTRTLMLELTPFALLLTGILAVYCAFPKNKRKIFFYVLAIFLFTFIIEAIGVNTGLIFGKYDYGNALGLKLFGVPLIIGFNWALVILGTTGISSRISKNVLIISVFTSILAIIFDFFLEPVAILLNYWNWHGNSIPLQNYLAWFLITLVAASVISISKIKIYSPVLLHYFLAQLLFFLLLGNLMSA